MTKALVVAPGGGDVRLYGEHVFVFKADAAETGGSFSLAEVLLRRGGPTPLHVHAREIEAFYVLEGEMEFQIDGEQTTVGPGSFVLLPRGAPHSFGAVTDEARVLSLWAPAGLEELFREFSRAPGDPDEKAPMDYEALGARLEELGVTTVEAAAGGDSA